MMQTKKSNTPSDIYISKYNEIRSLYPQHVIFLERYVICYCFRAQPVSDIRQFLTKLEAECVAAEEHDSDEFV